MERNDIFGFLYYGVKWGIYSCLIFLCIGATTDFGPLIANKKTMLLGANGQNIYPEEIEDKLASLPFVTECLVIQKGEHLYGLVYTDPDELKKAHISQGDLAKKMEENRQTLNQIIPSYARVHALHQMPEEFEKTPKKSIKRYIYTNYPV